MIAEFMMVNGYIRTENRTRCLLCETDGTAAVEGVHDVAYGTPGTWSFRKCQNSECGLVWLSPAPIEEDIPKLYLHYYTHIQKQIMSERKLYYYELLRKGILSYMYGYSCQPKTFLLKCICIVLSHILLLRDRIGGTVLWLESDLCGKLLDVGCGNGKLLCRLKELGWQVVGVEPDKAAAEETRKNVDAQVFTGFIEQANFSTNSFDVITMNHVIEHLSDPVLTLRECYRILKQGGHLVIVTPNTNSLGFTRYRSYWKGLDIPRHIYLFNSKCLTKLISNMGFTVISEHTSPRNTGLWWRVSNDIKRACLRQGRKGSHSFMPRYVLKLQNFILSMLYHFWESFTLVFNKNIGEEVVFFASKGQVNPSEKTT